MAHVYYSKDANIEALKGQVVAVIGYGNQGRSQALNLRDSGVKVIVGNDDDDYRKQALADGMTVYTIGEAASRADVLMFLLPDEIQLEVYKAKIEPRLAGGKCLVFSHGYNVFYGLISPPEGTDVVLVAPRMIGEGVRHCYLAGEGFPTLVAVEKDASGEAWSVALAVALGVGGQKMSAWETTFEEETVIDLFGEQVGGGSSLASTLHSFEILVDAGYNPDLVVLELYASGEMVEVFRGITKYGLLDSLKLHSPTSQYGQMSRARRLVPEESKETLRAILDDIRSGEFAKEWANEHRTGYANMKRLRSGYASHPMFDTERRVQKALRASGKSESEDR